ncbi:hypothetical protein GCM10010389_58260 [Streptomyces echinoruber]|uniref:Uncharacterized protein n=1 Tax=Streptomyces echinoruber TaxID=68898 RepID=A0A918RV24_9ACTN|nr:hypothetical protein GCM10010389_58260 [Streptomyces echinoruber]
MARTEPLVVVAVMPTGAPAQSRVTSPLTVSACRTRARTSVARTEPLRVSRRTAAASPPERVTVTSPLTVARVSVPRTPAASTPALRAETVTAVSAGTSTSGIRGQGPPEGGGHDRSSTQVPACRDQCRPTRRSTSTSSPAAGRRRSPPSVVTTRRAGDGTREDASDDGVPVPPAPRPEPQPAVSTARRAAAASTGAVAAGRRGGGDGVAFMPGLFPPHRVSMTNPRPGASPML